ncbi:hypothetical protein NE852_16645 [Rhizobium sp. Pop5]|uniref:hypothetical protein n=1 Tax=Rhizobium sp. Pop5 TaxID=1223565 RepID=UPI0002839906|nr:hypothetical protein [Rhizobium sp. Pop5]EJZ17304.1 hypothetical protein RCCGEPOP_31466 [Rhizobium sp. Pop5]UVD55710.1 hypothetical protein NE852_16645 [Rhizobium sp. Pop5]
MKSIHDGRRSDAASRSTTLPAISHTEATIKCVGPAAFRSEQARDFACLLDLDPEVVQWSPAPPILREGDDHYQLDFIVITESGSFLIDVGREEPMPPAWVTSLAESMGHHYRPVAMAELEGSFRLRNAKDLLRYGFYRPPLGDRIRLLAALDDMGSLNVAECMSAVREGRPMPTVAVLILQGFLEIDLDDALIGPDTQVRRIRS